MLLRRSFPLALIAGLLAMAAAGAEAKTSWPSRATPMRALVICKFHESASPVEGNADAFWNIQLQHRRAAWLIDSYGQG